MPDQILSVTLIAWLFEAVHEKIIATDLLELVLRYFNPSGFVPFNQNFTNEPSQNKFICAPENTAAPRSFLPFLLTTQNPELRNIFYSSGLYRAIPETFADSFGLPFSAVLWICSWFDPFLHRAEHFHSADFTRESLQLCKSKSSKLTLNLLAVICKCSPLVEYLQLLKQSDSEYKKSTPLDSKEEVENLLWFIKCTSQLSVEHSKVVRETLLETLLEIDGAGLAALLGSDELLTRLSDEGARSTFVCFAFSLHLRLLR